MTVATLAILYDCLHRFGDHKLLEQLATSEQVVVLLLAFLAGGLGAERLLTLKKIEDEIQIAQTQRLGLIQQANRLESNVAEILKACGELRGELVKDFEDVIGRDKNIFEAVKLISKSEVLDGPEDIEAGARRLLDECNNTEIIKATGQYHIADGLSGVYVQYLADRVLRAAQNQGRMEYT